MKKVLSIFFSIVLVIGFIPTVSYSQAWADETNSVTDNETADINATNTDQTAGSVEEAISSSQSTVVEDGVTEATVEEDTEATEVEALTEEAASAESNEVELLSTSVTYSAQMSNSGWLSEVSDGDTAGETSTTNSLETIKISLDSSTTESIWYKSSIQGSWESTWSANGAESGTVGESKPLYAIQIQMADGDNSAFDVYYRVYVASLGWLGWAKNGEAAGTSGYDLAVQAYQVQLVGKGGTAPGATDDHYLVKGTPSVSYTTQVQDIGWQSTRTDGAIAGTQGFSKRLEGLKVSVSNTKLNGSIEYQTHVQNIGWQGWVSDGEMSGTSGQSLRLEAIRIELTGELDTYYDVYYRVHAQNFGWMGWAKNGEAAGTAGYSYRIESIQIVLVEKGDSVPSDVDALAKQDTASKYMDLNGSGLINYTTHVENIGWQSYVSDGDMAGTSGQSLRLEGIKIRLGSDIGYSGSVNYQTHIQNKGWETGYKSDNAMSGTSGQSLRLEAIRILLTGDVNDHYDVYYRVHAQNFGWLGWVKNGESAGTAGYSDRLEAIQIILVEKGGAAPASDYGGIASTMSQGFIQA